MSVIRAKIFCASMSVLGTHIFPQLMDVSSNLIIFPGSILQVSRNIKSSVTKYTVGASTAITSGGNQKGLINLILSDVKKLKNAALKI